MKLVLLFWLLQAAPDANFDELARRAAAAVDSRPEEAVSLYRQALGLKPSWAEGWFYLGASLYQLNRYSEACPAFEKTTSLAADNGPALAFLGLCEYQLGEDEQAVVHIRRSEALGLGDNQAFVSAVRQHGALLLSRSSHFEEAMEQLQPLAVAGDKSPPVIEAYGLAALGMSRLRAEDKKELVTLAGQAAWSVVAQRPGEADAYYGQLLEKYGGEPGVHYAYGIYLLLRDPDGAAAQFRKELEVNSKNAFAYLQIAALDLKRGAPEQALGPARAAVRLDSNNALAHAALGRAFLMLGQTGDALVELEGAVKLSPESPQTHFFLELAYRRAGREADALKERAEFTRLKARQDPLSLPGR